MTNLQSDDPLVQEARRHSGRIANAMSGLAGLIQYAWDQRYDRVLGYPSWQAYCVGEFGSGEVAMKARQIVISLLSDAGMSQRSIAEQTGVSHQTVGRDLAGGPSMDQLNDNQQPEVTQSNQPSSASVLGKDNKVHPRIKRPKPTPAAIDALHAEIRKRLRAGKKTDFRQLMTQFEMSQSVVQTQIQVVRAVMEAEGQRPANSRAKNPLNGMTSAGRVRELKGRIRTESEAYLYMTKVLHRMAELSGVMQGVNLNDLYQYGDDETWLMHISDFYDELDELDRWVTQTKRAIGTWLAPADKASKAAKLRNVTGCTPEEAELRLAKADQLERQVALIRAGGSEAEAS